MLIQKQQSKATFFVHSFILSNTFEELQDLKNYLSFQQKQQGKQGKQTKKNYQKRNDDVLFDSCNSFCIDL